jgi:hypothetical protein
MNAVARVATYAVGLAVLGAASYGVGNAVGPVETDEPAAEHADGGHDTGESGHGGHEALPDAELPGGLMAAQDGYRLALADAVARPGRDRPIRFTVIGPDGAAVTAYDVEHEKRLHLIAVRRDFSGFQHVHPVLGEDGEWRTDLDLTSGQWRVFADFTPTGGPSLTLGTDLAVAGDYEPRQPTATTRVARVGGYTVRLAGDLVADEDARLTVTVSRRGEPVTDLQPYLGAYGHLVALREGDLAYLHVHPDGTPGDGRTAPGPDVVFHAGVPSEGRYHLYLDFKHDGVVRTAAFDLAAEAHHGGGHE